MLMIVWPLTVICQLLVNVYQFLLVVKMKKILTITLTNSKEDANGKKPANNSPNGVIDQENVKPTTLVTKLVILISKTT